jgi:carboxyl-terminal processing protease
MKSKLLWLVFAFVTAAQGASLGSERPFPAALAPEPQEARAAHMAAELLSRYHYKAMPLDESLSGRIFDQYLKSLDPEKVFFVQADIDQLSDRRTKLGSDMVKDDLSAPFAIFNLYVNRASERFAFARSLLQSGFSFQEAESYQFVRKNQVWPKTDADMRDLWRKRVKNDWLRLKLAGKDDQSIVKVLDKRYDNVLKRLGRVNSEDAFHIYMNAYTMAIEPHTNYMAPRTAADFAISMKLSLVGIGAVLTEVDEYTTIRELVPGGPAGLSGQLKVGDRIVGVGQGESGAMTDIMGNRLDDSVALIRGAPDTVVRLEVLPAEAGPDGKHKLVSLVRKSISLQEQAAKSSVHTITEGKVTRRIGVITLGSFYEDFTAKRNGTKDYKSATRDVARLLAELKEKKVDSILVDLRNNGGGSLSEAVELTGLFIGQGPVVQVRKASGDITMERTSQAHATWDGPLGVLINRGSASASEIFAAAIQDYGRGLIVGEPSFGKGTVQTIVNLDRVAKNEKPQFGELKMTVAQFFRINGGTTQLRGVTPDLAFPSAADVGDFGESSFDNALPWAQIKPANYSPKSDLQGILPALLAQHEARVKDDKDFQYLQEDIAEFNLLRKKNEVSLNEAERRKERSTQEARLATRKLATDTGKGGHKDLASGKLNPTNSGAVSDDGLQANERNLVSELAAEKARKNDKDVLLIEAVHVLSDAVGALNSNPNLAARVKQAPALTGQ